MTNYMETALAELGHDSGDSPSTFGGSLAELLFWWRVNAVRFPRLVQLARQFCAIPLRGKKGNWRSDIERNGKRKGVGRFVEELIGDGERRKEEVIGEGRGEEGSIEELNEGEGGSKISMAKVLNEVRGNDGERLIGEGRKEEEVIVERSGDEELFVERSGDEELIGEATGEEELIGEGSGDEEMIREESGDEELIGEVSEEDAEEVTGEESEAERFAKELIGGGGDVTRLGVVGAERFQLLTQILTVQMALRERWNCGRKETEDGRGEGCE